MPDTTLPDAAATWNQRFEEKCNNFGVEPNEFLRAQAPRRAAGTRVLCEADGNGANSVWLARQGNTPKQREYKTGGPPFLANLYADELLSTAFAALETVELRCYEAELHVGNRHTGRSALVGLVARKP